MGKKYSIYIKPLVIFIDLLIIWGITYFFSDKEYLNLTFLTYILILWLLIAFYTRYYNVYRYTHVLKIVALIASQFFVFILSFFAYFTIFREGVVVNRQLEVVISIIAFIIMSKLLFFLLLRSYRLAGKNYRNVIVFGENSASKNIAKIFNKRSDLGYRYFGFFTDNNNNSDKYLGTFEEGLEYIISAKVDEIYCEVSTLTENQLNKIRVF